MISPRLPFINPVKVAAPLLQHGFDVLAGLRLLDFELVGVRPGIDLAL